MKTKALIPSLSLVVLASSLVSSLAWSEPPSRALVATDVKAVYSVGTDVPVGAAIRLEDGLYEIEKVDSAQGEDHYMLVSEDVNNGDQFLALIFPKRFEKESGIGTGYFYQGRKLQNTPSLMLTPVHISSQGTLVIDSENQTRAPILEVTLRPGKWSSPYLIKGRNGAWDGAIRGMRLSRKASPRLRARPSTNLFVAGGASPSAVVNFPQLSLSTGSPVDETFNLVEINGDGRGFAAMTRAALDTMAETSIASENLSQLAVFMDGGCFEKMEVLMLLRPRVTPGQFEINLLHPAEASLWEKTFPGLSRHRK